MHSIFRLVFRPLGRGTRQTCIPRVFGTRPRVIQVRGVDAGWQHAPLAAGFAHYPLHGVHVGWLRLWERVLAWPPTRSFGNGGFSRGRGGRRRIGRSTLVAAGRLQHGVLYPRVEFCASVCEGVWAGEQGVAEEDGGSRSATPRTGGQRLGLGANANVGTVVGGVVQQTVVHNQLHIRDDVVQGLVGAGSEVGLERGDEQEG